MTAPLKALAQPPTAAPAPRANNYTDFNGLAALKKDPSSPQALRAVAQQIDALFLQMMLKSMRDAGAAMGESDSNEMGMYHDMFDKQVALSMSQHQSLGLGAQLTRQLAARAAAALPAAAPVAVPANAPATPAAPARGGTTTSGDAGAVATTPVQFVARVYPAIQRAAQALGVNPLAMLAQAALETGWGKRVARNADGTPSHNLFGIKADASWAGARAAATTVEFSGGIAVQQRTAFRAYGSVEESVDDFAQLLGTSPRYREAVAGGRDASGYIAAIGKSGYASDPDYANKLTQVMNSHAFRGAVLAHTILL